MSLVQEKHSKNMSVRSYQSVTNSLRGRIANGHWSAGAMLPSRAALAREHGVSLTTVQQAVSRLIGEGVLYTDGSRGTFVAQVTRPDKDIPDSAAARLLPVVNPVLGIVDTTSLQIRALRADAYGWIDTIATRLEAAFQHVNGQTHYFNPPPGDEDASHQIAVESLLTEGVNAIAIIGVFDEPPLVPVLATLFNRQHVPAVYISWRETPELFPYVSYDNRLAGYEAADYLSRSGYGPLAYFGREASLWSEQRLNGVRAAQETKSRQVAVFQWKERLEEAARQMVLRRALDQVFQAVPEDPSTRWGIIAENDLLALELQNLAAERGLTAGQDYGLIGFDNHPRSRGRGLTTLRPPLEALGEQSAQMLLQHLRGDRSCVQIQLRSQILPRASTRRS